jgi:ubiquinone/menaquinone biosynthesis C-methylase UbiE
MTIDPKTAAEMKAREQQSWSNAAPSWRKNDEMLTAFAAPVTDAMIQRAGIRAGMRVLDVACGTGHPAIPIAQVVGPTGSVLATDFAEPMVAIAREKAKAAGLSNIEFRVVDGEVLDEPEGSFDAATMRWGLMFMPDPVAAIRGIARAVRPGGRVAIVVWQGPEKVPMASMPMGVLRNHTTVPTPPPGVPGMFAFADAERLRAVLTEGGLHDVEIDAITLEQPHASPEAYWTQMREMAAPLRALYEALPPETRAKVDAEVLAAAERFRRGDEIVVPNTTWIARPRRLTHGRARQELLHDRLDVDHGCALDRVELGDAQATVGAADDAHDRRADAVRAVLATLREDADLRPRGVVARVAAARDDLLGRHAIEDVEDLGVREVLDAVEARRIHAGGELDHRRAAAPVVVFGLGARRADDTDRLDREGHGATLPPSA